jgi:hypothetical protein
VGKGEHHTPDPPSLAPAGTPGGILKMQLGTDPDAFVPRIRVFDSIPKTGRTSIPVELLRPRKGERRFGLAPQHLYEAVFVELF